MADNSKSTRGATAADYNWRGVDHANIHSCLSNAQIFDVISNTGALDLTSTIQSCLDDFGAVKVLWPAGTYKIAGNLTIPAGQMIMGIGTGDNAGSIISIPASATGDTFRALGSGQVSGFAFRAGATTFGQTCIHVANVNNFTIRENFFAGCSFQVLIDGSSFYTNIERNQFYLGANIQLYVNSGTGPGVDLFVRNNRFLGSTSDRTSSVARFNGLGSLIWSNNQISVSKTNGPLVWFEGVAPSYGGTQISESVFEQAGAQPAVYIEGSASAPILWFYSANSIYTSGTGPAIQVAFARKLSFTGDCMSSFAATGVLQFPAYGDVRDISLNSVNFEGDAGQSPIRTTGVGSNIGIAITNPKWTGSAPLVDFSNLAGAGALYYFSAHGGNPGNNSQPYRLPGVGEKISISYPGVTIQGKMLLLPTAGPGAGLYAEYIVPSSLVGGTLGACSKIAMAGTSNAYTIVTANVGGGC